MRPCARALDFGKGLVLCSDRQSDTVNGVFHQSRLPLLRPQFRRARSALVLVQFEARLVRRAVSAPASRCRTSMKSRRGEEIWWNDWYEHDPQACSACDGQRLSPVALNVRFRDRSIAALAPSGRSSAGEFFSKLKLNAREKEIARDLLARSALAAEIPGAGWLGLSAAGSFRADAVGRRSATHPAGRATGLEPAGRVLCARRAHHRPASPRQRHPARLARRARRNRNTLVVVEHDEDTIRRADHVLDLGPAAGVRGGEIVGSGTVKDLIRNPRSITGRFLREPLLHPARAAAAGDGQHHPD